MEEKQELEAVIDWVEVTFRDITDTGIMKEILQFPRDFMTFESRGRFRYAGKWSFSGIRMAAKAWIYRVWRDSKSI